MRTELACLPCFTRQVVRTLGYAGIDGEQGRDIMRRAGGILDDATLDEAPARISTRLHRMMRMQTGVDPYRDIKETYNRIALEHLPAVRQLGSGLEAGVRAAVAGNIIDFGIYDQIDLDRSLRESFSIPLPDDAWRDFLSAVQRADTVLYLCDNAGEIVFDRVLIDALRSLGKQVTAVVKGIPVINDATMADARSVGLHDSADHVIDNGNDGIGTLLELCSPQFSEQYRAADLIISKGQANYETLAAEHDDRTFFLFKVKCPVVARHLGRPEGDVVLLGPRQNAAR